MLVVDTVSS